MIFRFYPLKIHSSTNPPLSLHPLQNKKAKILKKSIYQALLAVKNKLFHFMLLSFSVFKFLLLIIIEISNNCCFSYRCAICMGDFIFGDSIRYLPCLHIYHSPCIDDWLMRSFTCPSCMEPVDAALLSTFHTV